MKVKTFRKWPKEGSDFRLRFWKVNDSSIEIYQNKGVNYQRITRIADQFTAPVLDLIKKRLAPRHSHKSYVFLICVD